MIFLVFSLTGLVVFSMFKFTNYDVFRKFLSS